MRRALVRIRPLMGIAALGLSLGWGAAFAVRPAWAQAEEEIVYTGHIHSWNDEIFVCHCGAEPLECVPCTEELPDLN
jgi:hypothetical protein